MRGYAALVALLADDAEVAELQAPSIADEDVQRGEVAVQGLAAVELAQHFENPGDFPSRPGLGPSLAAPGQERAQVAKARVLEREAVEDLSVGANQGKGVVDANRPRMSVQQLSEVRFAQPAVDAGAHLDADDLRYDCRAAETLREIHLAESALAKQSSDAVLKLRFGTRDDPIRNQKVSRSIGSLPAARISRAIWRGVIASGVRAPAM